jgi:hypothetical protein
MNPYLLAADMVVLVHLGIAAFIVLGFCLIWIGYFVGWQWIYNRKFRLAHLILMAIVTLESIIGLTCPLTILEDRLRSPGTDPADMREFFIQDMVHRILFYDIDIQLFTVGYIVFFIAICLTLRLIPPTRIDS